MRVLVLGAGKMIEAILSGLSANMDLSQWMIYSPSGVSAQKLANKVSAKAISDLSSVVSPDYIILGCKPQQLKDLAGLINGKFPDSLYISVLAALSEESQLKSLKASRLVRVMPNLPVEFRQGVSLISSQSAVDHLSEIKNLFALLGDALIVNEKELDELTLLTGSAPAFFYEFSKSLASSFVSLSDNERELLARKVLLGAGLAAAKDQRLLDEMIDSVTSKGGVTIAVLNQWRSDKMVDLIKKGILAGKKRTEELKVILQS